MELVGVADHEVVTMEGAMAMLGGVGDIFIRAVTPSKHWLLTVSFITNLKSISVPIYSRVLRRAVFVPLCCLQLTCDCAKNK